MKFYKGLGKSAELLKDFHGNQGPIEYEWTTSLVTIAWIPKHSNQYGEAKSPINGTITMIQESDER